MSTLREKILETALANHVLTENDLEYLLDGTPASRYALVNKAVNSGEIIRIRRGLYIMADKYRTNRLSKFFLASRIVPHSYISLESALSYHGWIPESVPNITSVTPHGRSRSFHTPFGEFSFDLIKTNEYEFLTGVERIEEIVNAPFLLATPLRALVDYVYIKKVKWQGLNFITEGLRIELDQLSVIKNNDFLVIKNVYRNKRVLHFIDKLMKELKKHGD